MSTGALIGIAVGCAGAVLLVGFLLLMCWWQRRKAKDNSSTGQSGHGIEQSISHQAPEGSNQDSTMSSLGPQNDSQLETPPRVSYAAYCPYRGQCHFLKSSRQSANGNLWRIESLQSHSTMVNPSPSHPYSHNSFAPSHPPPSTFGSPAPAYHNTPGLSPAVNIQHHTGQASQRISVGTGSHLSHGSHQSVSTGGVNQYGWLGGSTYDNMGGEGRYTMISELDSESVVPGGNTGPEKPKEDKMAAGDGPVASAPGPVHEMTGDNDAQPPAQI